MDKNSLIAIVLIAAMATLFGSFCVYMGYDNLIIAAVLGLLGTIGGYIYGRKEERKEESQATLQV